MFYMYSKLRKLNNFAAITNADNADMRDLAAKVTDEIPCVQGIYEKKVIFDWKMFSSEEMPKVIVPFHILTDTYCVSGFIGDEKKNSIYKSMKSNATGELQTTLYLICMNFCLSSIWICQFNIKEEKKLELF